MEYAVVRTGGKQYTVKPGETYLIEKVAGNPDDLFTFEEVLLHVNDGKIRIGNPLVSGMTILGTIVEQTKGEKILVSKFKAKARYRRVIGHRQKLTKIKIESIVKGTKETAETASNAADAKGTKKRTAKSNNK